MATKRLLFIHHSTGANLIREGQVRAELAKTKPDLELWDHGYNLIPLLPEYLAWKLHRTGLSDANSKMLHKDFDIIVSNNSPREYADIFSRDPGDSTLKQILEFDVIAFKNCYPTSKITSEAQLEEDKKFYEQIFTSLQHFPDKQFIVFTHPPLRSELTKPEYAQRSRELADWMVATAAQYPNLKTFDFFSILADEKNMLKREFCRILIPDGHPNEQGNILAGKAFVELLSRS